MFWQISSARWNPKTIQIFKVTTTFLTRLRRTESSNKFQSYILPIQTITFSTRPQRSGSHTTSLSSCPPATSTNNPHPRPCSTPRPCESPTRTAPPSSPTRGPSTAGPLPAPGPIPRRATTPYPSPSGGSAGRPTLAAAPTARPSPSGSRSSGARPPPAPNPICSIGTMAGQARAA